MPESMRSIAEQMELLLKGCVDVVRPEDLNLMVGGTGGENVIEGRVAAAMFMGDSTEFRVALKDTALRLKLHPSTTVAEGQTIRIELPAERCRALMG